MTTSMFALARGVQNGWTATELFRLCMVEYPRSLHNSTAAERQAAIAIGPPLTGTIWDAAVGASIEHACLAHGLKPPGWTDDAERFRDTPEELLPQWTETVLCYLPAPYTRHGVIIDPRNLNGRTGDPQWSPELGDPNPHWPRELNTEGRRIQGGTAEPKRRVRLRETCTAIERQAIAKGYAVRTVLHHERPPEIFALRALVHPHARMEGLPAAEAKTLVEQGLQTAKANYRDWVDLITYEANATNTNSHATIPPRTVWSTPGLTVAGTASGVITEWENSRTPAPCQVP